MNINILTIPDNEEFMSIEVDNNKPVKEIKKPIVAALPIHLLIGQPKYLNIGTFIIAPVIPIGAEINPDKIPKIIRGESDGLGLIFLIFSCANIK